MKIEFGDKARDIITGFQGIVTGKSSYITGCDRYCLNPGIDKDGKTQESLWFDENSIEVIQAQAVVIKPVAEAPALRAVGGPSGSEVAPTK